MTLSLPVHAKWQYFALQSAKKARGLNVNGKLAAAAGFAENAQRDGFPVMSPAFLSHMQFQTVFTEDAVQRHSRSEGIQWRSKFLKNMITCNWFVGFVGVRQNIVDGSRRDQDLFFYGFVRF